MELFHALLALEWGIPRGPGELPHFFAVSSYALQHPVTMRYTEESARAQREAARDALEGRIGVAVLRQRARSRAEGARRVVRHDGEPIPEVPVTAWPMTVADVVAGGVDGYAERVARWARSVVDTLDAAEKERG